MMQTYLQNKDFFFLFISPYYSLSVYLCWVYKHADNGATMTPGVSLPPQSDAGNHIRDIANLCMKRCPLE